MEPQTNPPEEPPRQKRKYTRRKKRRNSSTRTTKELTPTPTTSSFTQPAENPERSLRKRTRTFVYRPQDEGDKLELDQGGVIFRANVPVEVPDTVMVQQLVREERETKDGLKAYSYVERMVPLYQVLGNNPWFEIDGKRPERQKIQLKLPQTPDEYRGFAIEWITRSSSAVTLEQRWISEAGLRDRCGVSPGDLAHILPVYENRRKECADIDAMRTGAL